MLFDVRLLAFEATADGDPADALVRVFGLDHRAARELLRRLPHVVKRGVTEEGAHKLVNALDRIGARTEIVVSASGPREPKPAPLPAPNANVTGRLGALPAPSPAASAMIDARAAREQAVQRAHTQAVRVSQSQPAPQRGRSSQLAYAAPVARMPSGDSLPTLPDDDSLEADIGTPSHAPEAMLERSTLVAAPRAVPAQKASVPQPAPSAQRAPSPQRAPGATTQARMPVAAAAQPAPTPARLSIPQPVTPQAPAASQAFRVALPQPAAQAAAPDPSLFGPAPITMSQPMVAANAQRPAGATTTGSMPRVTLSGAQRAALPTLSIHGPPVEASACVVPQTKGAIATAWVVVVSVSLCLTLLTLGVFALVALAAAGLNWLSRRRTLAALRASALPIGQSQLPELYACVKQFSLRLGFSTVPRMYLMAGPGGLRATTDGPELVLILDEATLLLFLDGSKPQGLSALIAHELARHALGHTKWARRTLARISPRVAYLDLVSADSTATALVLDHSLMKAALLSLLGVSRMSNVLDHDELDRVATSATREPAFWSTRFSTDDGFVLARLYHLQRGYV